MEPAGWNIEYRNGVKPTSLKVFNYFKHLNRIPSQIRKLLTDNGARIIFFNGPLTDQPEAEHLKGIQARGWPEGSTYDKIIGVRIYKDVLVGISGEFHHSKIYDALLHELGHVYDDIVGNKFYNTPLSHLPSMKTIIYKEPFKNHYFDDSYEYIANAFDLYYRSNQTKQRLEKQNPIIFSMLKYTEDQTL